MKQLVIRAFRVHAWLYGFALLLAGILILLAVKWWFFWPLMIWSLLFLVHFLVVKTLGVSNDWVAARSAKVEMRASDISHIESIRERYEGALARSEKTGEEAATPDESLEKRS